MEKADDIYGQYAELVYKYLYRLTGNRELSEELTQETFYQALRTLRNFKGRCGFSTWLCQIAKHCWYKYLHNNSKNRNIPLADTHCQLSDENTPETIFLEMNDRIFMYSQIHQLKEPYREVVLLRISGLSFSEIAAVMDKTENWARITFHRAKIKLIEGNKENGDKM